ncbi:hypothetical protein Drorol1_Dr00001802 [Drosera rotundifolia]
MTSKDHPFWAKNLVAAESCSPMESDGPRASTVSQEGSDKGVDVATCRVCHCIESDRNGDIVLGFLGISPPVEQPLRDEKRKNPNDKKAFINYQENRSIEDEKLESGYLEFISPEGEIFICRTDIETGDCTHQDALIELGCSCKNDLALVHYACALKWFVSHGSTVCEICGYVATNIRSADFKKVIASLCEYDELRERTASGVPNPAVVHCSSGVVDPDALAAIRRQRLSEISLWFNPHHSNLHQNNNALTASHVVREAAPGTVAGEAAPAENQAAKWAVEGTGILLATGLLTVSLAWLIAPRVGKKTAKNGLHILLGGVCALAVVVFFRFVVLTRIKYGPARYWAILFVFWFLVFGIWASRTHSVHTT